MTDSYDDDDLVEVTLRQVVYDELLIRLDRFAERQDSGADRSWLRKFVADVRLRERQGLH